MIDTEHKFQQRELEHGGDNFKLSALLLTGLLTACSSIHDTENHPADGVTLPPIGRTLEPASEKDVRALFAKVVGADPPKLEIQQKGPTEFFEQGGFLGLSIQDPNNPRKLDITRDNYQENMGWVVGYLRQLRFEGNPVLSDIRDRVESGNADRIERCIYNGIWFSPANNARAFDRANIEFNIGEAPLGTIGELRKTLTAINSNEPTPITLPNSADGSERRASFAEIKYHLLRNPGMFLTVTNSSPDGAKEEVLYDAAKIKFDELRFDSAIFSLRLQHNPVLKELALRKDRGELSGSELAAFNGVMKHPCDMAQAYQASEAYFYRLEQLFPEKTGAVSK